MSDPLPPSTATGNALLVTVTPEPGRGAERSAHQAAERLGRIDYARVTVAGGSLTDNEFNAQAQSDVQRAEMLTTPVVPLLLLTIRPRRMKLDRIKTTSSSKA